MSFDGIIDCGGLEARRTAQRTSLGTSRTALAATAGGPGPRYRSVWISDCHLGTRGCRAERLADFLGQLHCETLYLVGDIVDGWALKKAAYWPAGHTVVVRQLLELARDGNTRVVYVPGNHDEVLRDYLPIDFNGIELRADCIHETAAGRRYLVIHGDAFDAVCTEARWLAVLGDAAYRGVIRANGWFNTVRRRLGYPYWSLSAYLKHRVKNAAVYIARFEAALAGEARRRGVDGVVCGHIHTPARRMIDGIDYCNTGDWVESCSALAEDVDGCLHLIHWGRTADAARSDTRLSEAA